MVEEEDDVDVFALPLDDVDPRTNGPADMLVCRHVLEHVAEPLGFVRRMCDHLKLGAGVYFEVPEGSYAIGHDGPWDIIYEHCTYFFCAPLRWVLSRGGLAASRVTSRYDGQFLCLEGHRIGGSVAKRPEQHTIDDAIEQAVRFDGHQRRIIEYWGEQLEGTDASRPTVVWGAGSKGSSFVNLLDPGQQSVQAVVDINPRRHRSFVGGTGHPVVGPDDLAAIAPARVIVANPIYRAEIRRTLEARDLHPEILVLGHEPVH